MDRLHIGSMEPGQYAEYPRGTRGEVDFSVIGEAFQVIFKHPGPMLTASALGYFIPLCITYVVTLTMEFQMGMFSPTASQNTEEMLSKMGQLYAVQIPLTLVMLGCMAVFGTSLVKMTLKSLRGETVEFSDVFSGFQMALPALGVVFLSALAGTVGVLACCVGSLLVYGLLMLALPYMVDQKMSVIDSMKASWQTMRPHMWIGMLLFLVYSLVMSLGAIACLVGVLVTFPIYYVVPTLVYRDLAMPRAPLAPANPDYSA